MMDSARGIVRRVSQRHLVVKNILGFGIQVIGSAFDYLHIAPFSLKSVQTVKISASRLFKKLRTTFELFLMPIYILQQILRQRN